jgi:CHAT domain-containing protein/tetratricopeptide (TPR) repeat protein
MQSGSDLIVTFRNPQGSSIEIDSANGRYGPETVAAIAETAGEYQLQVKLDNPRDGSNTYEVLVLELREAAPLDREVVAAHRNYVDGHKLWQRHTPETRRQAIEKLERALDYFRSAPDRYMTGLTLFTLGAARGEAGEFRRALTSYEEAAGLFHADGDRHGEAAALNNSAGALDVLGDLAEALRFYREALSLFVASGDHSREALLRNNIGWTETNLAKWQDALQDYGQALMLARQVGDRRVEAQVLNNLGVTYRQLGEPEQALSQFEQALPLWRATGNKRGEATTLDAMANVYTALNQPAEAAHAMEQALVPWRNLGDPRGEAEALTILGAAYADLKRFEESRRTLVQALKLGRKSQDRRTTGRALANLGRASLLAGGPAQAVEWSAQALTEFRALGDRNDEAMALETVARAENSRGNFTEARRHMEEALRVTEAVRVGADSEQLRASFFATQQEAYRFYIHLLMRTGVEALALEASERSRARSLLEMLAGSGAEIRQGVDPQLLERQRDMASLLNAKGARLLPLLGTSNPQRAELTGEIHSLESEYQDVQAAIRRSSPRYAALTQPSVLTATQIQTDLLDRDTLLLEYSLGEERSYLWVAGKDGLRTFVLPSRARIEEQVRQVTRLLSARTDAALPAAARELSEMVIGKAAPALLDKRLVIVPDGALQALPFAMLPVPGTQEPLLVRHEVLMAPSASALAAVRSELAGRKPAHKMLAVFADPVFGLDDPRAGSRASYAPPPESSRILEHLAEPGDDVSARLKIPRLPFTAQEADQILSVARSSSNPKAIGFEATRATAISGRLSEYRYLHFATHGYLDTERPSLSALVLSQIDAKGQPEDGFLRVNDIYNARLSADLVVLSGCQTGLGKEVRGEGLMGLTRAFLYAGVPRVVVSLWNVNDRATAELMAALYRSMLRDGKRPSAALREAQLELRKQKRWESPYYWAAFVQHGEWR